MSSSPAGYIIIPQLSHGDYHLTIGFPGNQAPEASFSVKVDGSDRGYMLRKAGSGFALYTLQDFKKLEPQAVASAPGNRIVQVPATQPTTQEKPEENQANSALPEDSEPDSAAEGLSTASSGNPPAPSDTDAFSRMLNEITGGNAPATAQTTPPQTQAATSSEADTQEPEAPVTEEDTGALAGEVPAEIDSPSQAAAPEADSQAAALPEPPAAPPAPDEDTQAGELPVDTPASQEPASQNKGQDKDLQFIDFAALSPQASSPASGQAPPAAPPTEETPQQSAQTEPPVAEPQTDAEATGNEAAPDTNLAPVVPESPEPADSDLTPPVSESNAAPEEPVQSTGPVMANSDCQQTASEGDFQKVRRKMASRNDEEGMYRIAEKYLEGGTCYSTAQIRSLTYLFMTDEYKYKFLELAYPHISDAGHFSQLIKTLSTDYYRGRFQAMIK